ncbi:restriction endonuclease subunit S [Gorillibacterium massiliense]|uniref:restriction endonuclease subunit S n=1 Tax=Gorillibacterium massiliense TaxID=1280390 RepID=UPI0004BAB64D|nr:restriction endonuclease subunit S [Gorillibacterium massiliense]
MSVGMNDSGIEWIGEIPDNWNLMPVKAILMERNETNNPIQTDFILSLTVDKGVIPYNEKTGGGNKAKEDLTAYKLTYPKDIVLNSMNILAGSVGISKYFGCVSPVYYTLYVRDDSYSIDYFNNIFQTKEFQANLRGLGNGIMIKESGTGKLNTIRMRISMSKLNRVMLPVPPKHIQEHIANVLDKKCTEIDETIESTRLSIEEYKKYKKSIITETVYKGLKNEVELKESEINYIGTIPKHWKVKKIKNVLTPLNRPVLQTDDVITCFRDGEVTLRKNRRTDGYTFSDTEKGYQGVEIGDLVIHGMDAFAGAIGISDSRGKCTPVVHVCESKENKRYYMYLLRSFALNDVFMALSEGVRIRSSDFRNWDKLAKIMVVSPPLSEQKEIADYLDSKCIEIDNLIVQKQKVISELETYKKSLIYEIVTGKKEV